ncbi:diguanylate cyclase (GGDEF)-like protein [Stenotrophomonas rhizophila]|uniref:GGDEF domain-containing protein n=1 Tax=Stenotrophomonas TaxID=40323 RepID=UPI000F4BB3CC|nr:MULTISPECIES: GGDEF domain-containing protein [Stenotrophomonas]MCW6027634.1 GGDEF domain-containing protein [Stenotrophomonas sp. SRS1]ROP76197.1 diguanylate cyclase (GGDEF)-like protein [Stenotrophomonas rhizophila]
MLLDFPTIAVLGFLLCLGIAMGFSLLLLVLRRQPALRLWTASLWLLSVSLTLVAVRPYLPPVSGILASNVAVALSGVLMLYGVARHLGHRLPPWQPVVLCLSYLGAITFFLLVHPSLVIRLHVFSVFAVLLNGWMTWLLLRQAPPAQRTSCRLAAAVFGAQTLLYLIRLFLPVAPDAGDDIMRAGSPVFATYLIGLILELARCFALVLLLVERMLVDLQRLARTDVLTGLLNRGAVLADGANLLSSVRRAPRPLALLLLDVDHFKQINDRWGHLAGDAVLRRIADVLAGCVADREHLLGRYGGEEFIVLLPGADAAGAMQYADRILHALRASPALIDGVPVPVTASIGLAIDRRGDIARLLGDADAALYQAKAEGRDRTVMSGPAQRR